jgi:hypothetical protein
MALSEAWPMLRSTPITWNSCSKYSNSESSTLWDASLMPLLSFHAQGPVQRLLTNSKMVEMCSILNYTCCTEFYSCTLSSPLKNIITWNSQFYWSIDCGQATDVCQKSLFLVWQQIWPGIELKLKQVFSQIPTHFTATRVLQCNVCKSTWFFWNMAEGYCGSLPTKL